MPDADDTQTMLKQVAAVELLVSTLFATSINLIAAAYDAHHALRPGAHIGESEALRPHLGAAIAAFEAALEAAQNAKMPLPAHLRRGEG